MSSRSPDRPRWDRAARARWEKIARDEPYYAVLAQERYLSARIEETATDFFDSGESDVEQILQQVKTSGRTAPLRNVVEFGCGPGRLLPALARRGFAVTAVDRSPSMLTIARANAERHGASGVRFVDLDGFLREEETYDLIIVSRVLQHMPADAGLDLLAPLTERLGDNAVLHLIVPFATARGTLSRTLMHARLHVPLLNRAANMVRRRAAHVPVFAPHIYSLGAVMRALHGGGCQVAALIVRSENELVTAHLAARKSHVPAIRPRQVELPLTDTTTSELEETTYIDPAAMIQATGIAELNARAEAYFAGMDSPEEQIAKPFANARDAPAMLVSLGVMLHGAHLARGMTVLDFGGGTGWLSRLLLQFGCDVILCDVSRSALRIGTELIERHPPIGANIGRFRTLEYDGRHIDLPADSVDRVVSFDAFHHVPNVADTIGEIARILRPGGLAVFSEPGPHHSQSPQSQFEMRVHGVLENDVDIGAIWEAARNVGFTDLKLAAFDGAPRYIATDEFDELLRGGPALDRAARSLRDFTAGVRTFTLRKAGTERQDSRAPVGLACNLQVELDAAPSAGVPTPFTVRLTNTGTAVWLPSHESPGGVSVGAHLYRDATLAQRHLFSVALSDREILPGEQTVVHAVIPPLPPGHYLIEFDCVADGVQWFSQSGSEPVRVPLTM